MRQPRENVTAGDGFLTGLLAHAAYITPEIMSRQRSVNLSKKLAVLFVALNVTIPSTAIAGASHGDSFLAADSDCNAALTPREFKTFIDHLAETGHKNARRVRAFNLYRLAWSRVDINNDGVATRNELLRTKMSFEGSPETIKVSAQ